MCRCHRNHAKTRILISNHKKASAARTVITNLQSSVLGSVRKRRPRRVEVKTPARRRVAADPKLSFAAASDLAVEADRPMAYQRHLERQKTNFGYLTAPREPRRQQVGSKLIRTSLLALGKLNTSTTSARAAAAASASAGRSCAASAFSQTLGTVQAEADRLGLGVAGLRRAQERGGRGCNVRRGIEGAGGAGRPGAA